MKSLLLVLLVLAPSSLVFGQEDNPVPRRNESSRQERMRGFWQQVDTNHDGQIDAEEVQAEGPRASMIEGLIRRAGLEPKYPIKVSDIQEAVQKTPRPGFDLSPSQDTQDSKKSFKSLQEILESMPRKPEKGDNNLAAQVANKWLQNNAIGSVIQFTGKISHIGQISSRDVFLICLLLESKQGVWEGYNFNLSVHATAPPKADINNYSKISQGDLVTIEGKISNLTVEWGSGNGTIQLSLSDCKLISVAPATPSMQVDEKVRRFAVAFLKQSDKDKSGTLEKDKGEWTEIRGTESIDKDHNDIITLDELAAYYQPKIAPNAKPTNLFEATDAPKQPNIKTNTGTTNISGGNLTVQKAGKFWSYATDTDEYAVRLDVVDYVHFKTNNPINWHILIHLKMKENPIRLYFNEKEKAQIVYQNLLQALESGSGSQVIEGIGVNPEAGLRGKVRMQNAPVRKPIPPEEKKGKNLFD